MLQLGGYVISLATVNMSPFHTDLGRYANVNA